MSRTLEAHAVKVLGAWIVLVTSIPVMAADWPGWRGIGGSGVSAEMGLPSRWSAAENLRWKAELPGRGVSSPVIASGRLYLTASSGVKQDRLHVLSFDAATGRKLWERQLWATGDTQCHPKTCMAAPTPASDGARVYALFATCDLAAFDESGRLLWYRSLARDYPNLSNQVGMAASPILWEGLLIIDLETDSESLAVAVDTMSGMNRWKIPRQKGINWTTPLIFQGAAAAEVVIQSGRELTAYDPRSGERRWVHAADMDSVASPVAGRDAIFVPGGSVAAIRPGAKDERPRILWESPKLRAATASPLYHEARVYAINSAGILACADASTGTILWQERLEGPFSASPVAGDGKLYCVNEEGVTMVVDLRSEKRIVSANPLGEAVLASPAISGGAIFIRSDKHLWAIGPALDAADAPAWKSLPIVEPTGEKAHTGSFTVKDPERSGWKRPPFRYDDKAARGRKLSKVIVVIYDPVLEKDGGNRLTQHIQANDPVEYSRILVNVIREASWGYINYEIVGFITVDGYMEKVDGFRYTDDSFLEARKSEKWQPSPSSYRKVFEENGLIERFRKEGLNEVWLWGASGMHIDEFAGYIPNRYARFPPTDNPWFYRPYDIPEEIGRTVWVMGFNYEVGPDNMIHSYTHRVESMAALGLAGGIWDTKRKRDPWNAFSFLELDHKGSPSMVGNCHVPPNGEGGYDYDNKRKVLSWADAWTRYPDLRAEPRITSSAEWGNSHFGYQKWILERVPKFEGATEHGYNNWWVYIANTDEDLPRWTPPDSGTFRLPEAFPEARP